MPSLASHQTSSLGKQPPQHPRLWFGFARYVLSRLMAYVAQSKPLSMSFFLLYFKDITFIHTTSSSDVDLSLLRCLSPLSPLCSFSHCPCCGQLLIVHHVVTSVPATLIADVTVEIGGDVFKTEWSTCVFDIISHQKGFPSPLFKGKFKSRCDSRDGGECVKKN